MKKTIIFDVDGTLLDSERVYMQAWKEAGAKYGYTITDEVLLQTRAVNSAVAEAAFRRGCGEDFPLDLVHGERVRIAEAYFASAQPESLWKPHVWEALQWVKDRGYTMAVASTTALEKTLAHLEHAKLLDFFSVVVCGDMVEHGKPEPDIFLKAAELAGAKIEDCLVVGDSPADVKAAAAAGMPVVLIPDQVPLNPYTEATSWKILHDLGQLPEVIQIWDCK